MNAIERRRLRGFALILDCPGGPVQIHGWRDKTWVYFNAKYDEIGVEVWENPPPFDLYPDVPPTWELWDDRVPGASWIDHDWAWQHLESSLAVYDMAKH